MRDLRIPRVRIGFVGMMVLSSRVLYSVRTDAVMQVTALTSVLTLLTLAYLA